MIPSNLCCSALLAKGFCFAGQHDLPGLIPDGKHGPNPEGAVAVLLNIKALLPSNETNRLAALKAYHILDTGTGQCCDDITALSDIPGAGLPSVTDQRYNPMRGCRPYCPASFSFRHF